MKILLDNIIYSKEKQGGISSYWYEWSDYLISKKEDTVLFYDEIGSEKNMLRNKLNSKEMNLVTHTPNRSELLARLSKVTTNNSDYLIYHSSYYRALKRNTNFSEVTTVHDFTHDYYASSIKKYLHNKLKYNAIKRAKGVICVSKNTYTDLKKFCPLHKDQKIEVIYNGVSNDYFPIKNYNQQQINFISKTISNKKFILYVGSRADYKNFGFAVEIIKTLDDVELLIVGAPLNNKELKLFGSQFQHKYTVVSQVSNELLNVLYNNAHALLYPSSYEGFGIPVIEAMKAGCPVLALNRSSIGEISGKAALLFDDLDIQPFKKAILNLNNIDYRQHYIALGIEQAKLFSWEKCCSETYDFYKELY